MYSINHKFQSQLKYQSLGERGWSEATKALLVSTPLIIGKSCLSQFCYLSFLYLLSILHSGVTGVLLAALDFKQ